MYTPSKAEFLELAKYGNLIPVYREIVADTETPVSAYQKMQKSGGSFLLESVEGFTEQQVGGGGLIPGDAVIREFIGGSTIKIPHNE